MLFLAFLGLGSYKSLDVDRSSISDRLIVHFMPKRGVVFYGLALLFLVIFLSFTTVDAGYVGVVTRYGNVNRLLPPGPHLVIPVAEAVHPLTTQTLTVKPSEQAASHDLQVVNVQVTLAYHFDPQHVGFIYSQLSDASPNAVENKVVIPAILEAIKARVAQYDAQQLIGQRPAVRDGIESFVTERLRPYHIVCENTSITNFSFSDEYEKSIEAKVTAGQLAEKAQNDLQRVKIEAEQKIAAAEGEAKALAAQKAQVTPELIRLRQVEVQNRAIDLMWNKWDGHLPTYYFGGGNGNSPMALIQMPSGSYDQSAQQKK